MTIAELVCELMYAGKTRAEIAGYDDAFMRWVLCRKRDEYGKLLRHDPNLPAWVTENLDGNGHWKIKRPESYGAMLMQTLEQRGLSEWEKKEALEEWRKTNPKFGVGGE